MYILVFMVLFTDGGYIHQAYSVSQTKEQCERDKYVLRGVISEDVENGNIKDFRKLDAKCHYVTQFNISRDGVDIDVKNKSVITF